MKVYTQVLTFGSTPVQFNPKTSQPSAAGIDLTHVDYMYAECISTNAHDVEVGVAGNPITSASLTGIISEISVPSQDDNGAALAYAYGVRHPYWDIGHMGSGAVDVTQFYFQGFVGEGAKVSIFVKD